METVQDIQLTALTPNDWNYNMVPEKVMKDLKRSIERDGFNQPIIVRIHPKDPSLFQIVDGEHRYIIMGELQRDAIPCIVKELSDYEAMAMTITMNKFRGEADQIKLAALLKKMAEYYSEEQLEDITGYTKIELDGFGSLLEFNPEDFDSSEDTRNIDGGDSDLEAITNTFEVSVSLKQLDIIEGAIKVHPTQDRAAALTDICRKYLKETSPLEYEAVEKRVSKMSAIETGKDIPYLDELTENEVEL